MFIEFNPLDPLFFRDGKPFDMGVDNFGSSHILPPLTTLHGALVSHYIRTVKPQFKMALEYITLAKKFQVELFLIKLRNVVEDKVEYFLPAPSDLVQTGECEDGIYSFEQPKLTQDQDAITSSPFSTFLTSEIKAKSKEGIFLVSVDQFEKYLDGERRISALNLLDFITPEPKIGIAIDKQTRRAKEEHLYQQIQRRYERNNFRLSFILKTQLPEEGLEVYNNEKMTKLGGEGRLVLIHKLEDSPKIQNIYSPRSISSGISKLYFATPFPNRWDLHNVKSLNFDNILTASIPKPTIISGFDMANRKQKPSRTAIPAGAVYYFKDVDLSTFHGQAIDNDQSYQGYGRVFVGTYKE